MHRNGHRGASLLAYAPLLWILASQGYLLSAIAGVGIVLATAMVPDYDMRIPGLKHRGASHTLWTPALVGLVVFGTVYSISGGAFARLATIWGVAAFVSVTAHLAADSLTPVGIVPFWPVSDAHYSLSLVRAGNPIANGVLYLLGIASTLIVLSVALGIHG